MPLTRSYNQSSKNLKNDIIPNQKVIMKENSAYKQATMTYSYLQDTDDNWWMSFNMEKGHTAD